MSDYQDREQDALEKLGKLGIAEQIEGRFRAVPIEKALEVIDNKWDNIFDYSEADATV